MTRMLSSRNSLAGDRQVKIHVLGGRYGNYQRGGDNWITVSQSRLTQTIQRIQRTGGRIVDIVVATSSTAPESLGSQSSPPSTAKSAASKSSYQKEKIAKKPEVVAEKASPSVAAPDVVPLKTPDTKPSRKAVSKIKKKSHPAPVTADLTVVPVPDEPAVIQADIPRPQPITSAPVISHSPKEDISTIPVTSPDTESASSPEIPSLSRHKRVTRGFSDSPASSRRKKRRKSRRKSKRYLMG